MNGSGVLGTQERSQVLNAIPLQNAVLCAECDVLSDSPDDSCQVCGSHSLFNVARIFGGVLPRRRARLMTKQPLDAPPPEVVVVFPKPHRPRRKATGFRPFSVTALDGHETQPERVKVGPQSD